MSNLEKQLSILRSAALRDDGLNRREQLDAINEISNALKVSPQPCDLGMGCEEVGVCYASAQGSPDMCGKSHTSSVTNALVSALRYVEHTANGEQELLIQMLENSILAINTTYSLLDHETHENIHLHAVVEDLRERMNNDNGNLINNLYNAASVGFHISESNGLDKKYHHVSKFQSLQELHQFCQELHQFCDTWNALMITARDSGIPPKKELSFQERVDPWVKECFGEEVSADITERCDRFLEEVLELLQSLGYDPSRVATLRDYVWGRPVGEPHQEVGGVMVTMAALCLAAKLDMHKDGDIELERVWTKMEQIRAKQSSKNDLHSPLPGTYHE